VIPLLCVQTAFLCPDEDGKKTSFRLADVVSGGEISVGDEVEYVLLQSRPNSRAVAANVRKIRFVDSRYLQRCQPSHFCRDFPAFTPRSRLPEWDVHIPAFHDLCRHAVVIVYYALTAVHTSNRIATTNTPNGLKWNAPTYYK